MTRTQFDGCKLLNHMGAMTKALASFPSLGEWCFSCFYIAIPSVCSKNKQLIKRLNETTTQRSALTIGIALKVCVWYVYVYGRVTTFVGVQLYCL